MGVEIAYKIRPATGTRSPCCRFSISFDVLRDLTGCEKCFVQGERDEIAKLDLSSIV